MNTDMIRFHRGQVWVIRFKDQNEPKGHEQQKDRPWLVVSTAIYNHTSGMITCVPLTSRSDVQTPAHVHMNNLRGQDNIILCEQIRSFDYTCGAYLFDYVGTVNDNILEAVDVALSVHLGMHYSPVTLDSLYKSMEAVVKSVTYMQTKANAKFTDDDILEFATKLEQLALNGVSVNQDTPEEKPKPLPAIPVADTPKTNFRYNPTDYDIGVPEDEDVAEKNPESPIAKESPRPVVSDKKSKRVKWTTENCKEFLDDASTLPMKEVMDKWGISQKTKFYYMKNYAKSKLNEMN